ncbi:hypothetical protein BD779DRAFT_1804006 [Infundibulicybe gibba]|nr:hypothetical protein BD779DRAFT_1804006 [Infundibulicybe gibba]
MCGILELTDLTLETPAIPPLPPEVIDLIIDQLAGEDDRRTLKSCSLVCRSWLPRARHYLFSTISVVRTKSIPALHLLRSPLCTIHPHVRRLELCVNPSSTASMATFIQEINARSTLLLLRMKTSPGAGLTLVDGDLQVLLPMLRNLRHLKLQHFRFKTLENRIRLFSSLPALETLVIYGVDSQSYNTGSPSKDDHIYTMPPPANLRHIFIGTVNVPHELHWLTVHCRHPLTTLHLHNLTSECLPILLDYLRQSSQLQCLSFDFCRWETPEDLQFDLMARIDLTSQQDLRCLRLNSSQVVPILFMLLPRIRSSRIEEITMSTSGHYVDFAWTDLREIFMSPAARDLKRLYVDEDHIDEISETLPDFVTRGIILPLREGDFGHLTAELSLLISHY